ncbi:hypothetical protein SAMN04490183_1540 [Pseudomonas corrugata]|nr:hypothetical protein SAMN04490183_1540 [Pseudomonas corrugata]
MTLIRGSKQQHPGVPEQHDHPLAIPLMSAEILLAPSAFIAPNTLQSQLTSIWRL